jgi:hypothetical protein
VSECLRGRLPIQCDTNEAEDDIISRLILSASEQNIQSLALSTEASAVLPAPLCFQTLIALADEQINNVDFHVVSPKWLNLYVDASILGAIYDICVEGPRAAAVRKLDLAIIVGGATKPGRMEWIQRAIKLAQSDLYTKRTQIGHDTINPRKRRRLDIEPNTLFAYKAIPSLSSPPSLESYLKLHLEKPFVLRSYLVDGKAIEPWPAVEKWQDPEYLLSQIGRDRCVPVEEGSAYDDVDWGQRIVRFEDFLVRAGFYDTSERSVPTDRPMYLAQHSLFRQFPELERDVCLPDFVWSGPSAPPDYPSYCGPKTENGVIVNVWVGSGSGEIISPAHTVSQRGHIANDNLQDPYYNCYAQVIGRKRVWVAPPGCSPHMACHGSGSYEAGQGDIASQYMNNTSTIPILRPDVTLDELETKYPAFNKHVSPHCMETILEAGDLMVMPPGWWHAMRGEGSGPGWSVSMWY